MLDDAQATYSNKDSWAQFIKTGPKFIPGKVKFVIAATHMLRGGEESPVEFGSLCRVSRDKFLLSEADSIRFLESPLGLSDRFKFPRVRNLRILQSGGLIGALRLLRLALGNAFPKNDSTTVEQVLLFVLSNQFVDVMARLFGSKHSSPIGEDFQAFLEKIFKGETQVAPRDLGEKDEISLLRLQKSGRSIEMD